MMAPFPSCDASAQGFVAEEGGVSDRDLDIPILVDDPEELLSPGDLLGGKYRVLELIGSGGMSLVYVAVDESLGRKVALKLMRPEHAHRHEIQQRFLVEARILAQLSGPNIARVLDFGTFAHKISGCLQPYMAIEYLQGCDLAELLERRGTLSAEEAVDVGLEVCAGLDEAHALGVVHRDIKPENLFLAVDRRGSSTLKILDFGVSKQQTKALPVSARRLTQSGFAVGSPHYIAPEQLRSAPDVDARADIWSLGVVLFELLTGSTPFNSGSWMELCAQVLSEPTPDLRKRRVDLPEELVRVIERCLAKDRTQRYPSARELADALEAALECDDPVTTEIGRPNNPGLKSFLGVAACTAGVTLAVGLGYATRQDWLPSFEKALLEARSTLMLRD